MMMVCDAMRSRMYNTNKTLTNTHIWMCLSVALHMCKCEPCRVNEAVRYACTGFGRWINNTSEPSDGEHTEHRCMDEWTAV